MNGRWALGVLIGTLAAAPMAGMAAEHEGKEHGGAAHEHGGASAASAPASNTATTAATVTTQAASSQPKPAAEPSAEQLRQTIRDYIAEIEADEGAYTIDDEVTGDVRTLTLMQVHERVGKTGELYYSCTDMRDTKTNETLDLDFDVELYEGELEVVGERIHKVNGQPRYTYDDQDNRIPVSSAPASSSSQGS